MILSFITTLLGVLCSATVLYASIARNNDGAENSYLDGESQSYEEWKKYPTPVVFKVYLFNITNPEEVMNSGAKPNVQEIGPYVYHQLRRKEILSWDYSDNTVTYKDKKQYHFVPELSASLLNKVYTVNLPLQGTVLFAKKLSPLAQSMFQPLLEAKLNKYDEKLLVHKTARELLFDGYEIHYIKDLLEQFPPIRRIQDIVKSKTFGFLYGRNNSGDGTFSVYTGGDDMAKYTKIVTWNSMSRSVPFWRDTYCNMINGTDGWQFPPSVRREELLYMYSPEVCRSIYLEFEKNVNVQGIPAIRFVTPESLYASSLVNKNNLCYCTEDRYCPLSGMLDISSCRKGLKLAVTSPHFYLADNYYLNRISGLRPNKTNHETYVDIDPTTGKVLRASKKIQMNFIMKPFDRFSRTRNISPNVIPFLWVAEEYLDQ